MEKLLCPSMMCADFSNLKGEVEELEKAGIDTFHMDFMDGTFVPNFGMGLQDFQFIRSATKFEMDVHLMIQEPSRYIDKFADLGADIIYIHPEAETQTTRALAAIKEHGVKAGIALNPGTSIESVQELLPLVDNVLVMTVNPGFSGQKYLDFVDAKIEKLVKMKTQYHYKVLIDGAVSEDVISRMSKLGVEGFILGTSTLFGKAESYQQIMARLRQ